MNKLTCLETYLTEDKNHYGSFLIEPLEIGQGITLGNTLRRTLLSDLEGYAISSIRINNIKHEFSAIYGLREDVLELLLNLKEIILKDSCSSSRQNLSKKELKGFLNIKGPAIITAGMFNLPENLITIVNPYQYICTITDNSELYIEIEIKKGKGYCLSDENRKKSINKQFFKENEPTTLFLDTVFMPVRKVNYKVKLIHDSKGNIKESLYIEILTNSSITPSRALKEAIKIMIKLYYSIFLNNNFLKISHNLIR